MAAKKGNKYAVGNPGGGRDPFYDSPDEMEKRINDYFNTEKIWTIPGLAYHLGFADKKSLIDYEAKEVFQYSIKRAKLRIEAFNAKELHREKGNISGVIFTLKNLGWKDQQDFTLDAEINFGAMSEAEIDAVAFRLLKNKKSNGKNE